jgi:predicted RNase H-like HicB family nuclease
VEYHPVERGALPSTRTLSSRSVRRVPKLLKVELEREDDGRWIAEVPTLPGVLVYGASKQEALSKVQALALRVLADKIEASGIPSTEVRFAVA